MKSKGALVSLAMRLARTPNLGKGFRDGRFFLVLNPGAMEIQVIETPEQSLVDLLHQKIEEFNSARWDVKKKLPLAVQVRNDQSEVIAGAAAKTFGFWLLLDILWVSEDLRGQDMGSKILQQLETAAKKRGCRYSLLDTLDFQARPFYEKHGYKVVWTQPNYPREGSKHFMVKKFE